jgi:Ca2+:H+ antiporter
MTLFLPAAFFAALDRGVSAMASQGLSVEAQITAESDGLITDGLRGQFLKISRGLAILLLLV